MKFLKDLLGLLITGCAAVALLIFWFLGGLLTVAFKILILAGALFLGFLALAWAGLWAAWETLRGRHPHP